MSIYLIIILLILKTCEGKILEVKCPQHCLCDMFENLRRATCTDKNLVMLESFLPNQTQILDISHNQISELRQQIFQEENLLSLKSLNMSHNKLSQIHIHAFEGLKNLKMLDVSYNYLKYILSHWFEDMISLQELYLKGNSFMELRDSIFMSSSLRIIDLSQCKIAYIDTSVFKEATNLETLYLQENILFQFRIENIDTSLHLEILNLTGNELNCNNVNRLSKYCNSKGITLLSKSCEKVDKTKKFEKMILNSSSLAPVNGKNAWLLNDEENINCNYTSTIVKNKNETINTNILMDIFKLSPIISIITLVVCGFILGLIVGCTVQIKSSSNSQYEEPLAELIGSQKRHSFNCSCFGFGKKYSYSTYRASKKNIFKSTLSLNRRRNRGEDGGGLIEHLIDFPESTPVPQRRAKDSMTSFQ